MKVLVINAGSSSLKYQFFESETGAVLAKGGHLGGDTCTDILVQTDGTCTRWSHPRTLGISTHGTGCTLSSAVAAHLAHGYELREAVERALLYIAKAIATSHKLGELWAVNHHA